MARFSADRWPFRRGERRDPFSRVARGDLDILMPPQHDVSDSRQIAARERIEVLVSRLRPGGLDAGSREVLNNMINALADQEVARLLAERDERQSVGEILIGLAKKQVARRRPRYDADLTRMQHAHEALAVTFRALTGRELDQLRTPFPRKVDGDPVGSSFGPVDITDDWERSGAAAADEPDSADVPGSAGFADLDDPADPAGPAGPSIHQSWEFGSDSTLPTWNGGSNPSKSADTSSDPH
jgi:hypothetical protein